MQKIFLLTGCALAFTAVATGAFGAHALKDFLKETGRTDVFDTAVKYQFYHALGLLIIGALMYKIDSTWIQYAGIAMIGGIVIFSGSLYALCMTQVKILGAITPIGGVAFLAAWAMLFVACLKSDV